MYKFGIFIKQYKEIQINGPFVNIQEYRTTAIINCGISVNFTWVIFLKLPIYIFDIIRKIKIIIG